MELLTGALPAAILATVEGAEETVTLGPWTCEDYPAEGAYAGDYTFVTTLPEGYTLAEGVAALEVMVRFAEPEALAGNTVSNEAELQSALNRYGTVKLTANINVTNFITISGDKTLDLAGYTITYSGSDSFFSRRKSVFTLSNGSFTVKNGTLNGGAKKFVRCFQVDGGTLTIEGVNIQQFSCTFGGAIIIENGACTMNGGTISGNSASPNGRTGNSYGGGVYVSGSGTFTMNSGTISENTADYGGGVYVNSGTFTMTGGEISHNKANITDYSNGGGVVVYRGSFTMNAMAAKFPKTRQIARAAACLWITMAASP